MNIVGIDFSINSTAMCTEIDNNEKFYLFTRNISKNRANCLESTDIELVYLDKFKDSNDLNEVESDKVYNAIELSNSILKILESYDSYIDILTIEGFSYGGTGLRALDLAGFQYILRSMIALSNNIDLLKFVPPSTLKKFAIKGNASKSEMIESFMQLAPDNILYKILKNEECDCISKSGNYQKPFDDLVDSWYIKEFYKNTEL